MRCELHVDIVAWSYGPASRGTRGWCGAGKASRGSCGCMAWIVSCMAANTAWSVERPSHRAPFSGKNN